MVTALIKPPDTDAATWVAQLVTWLNACVAEQAAGKTIVTVQSGDTSTTKVINMSVSKRIEQLVEALQYYDTESDWSDFVPVRRTTVRFL